jgi:ankyrin repeat protein
MKRAHSPDNRPLLGQAIKIEEVPVLTSIPNEVNSPRIIQREPTQVRGFANEMVGYSQPVQNPSVSQLLFTNLRVNSPARFEQAPLQNNIPNTGNPALMLGIEPAQESGFGNGIVGQSQPAPNPTVNQLLFTNPRANSLPISPTINTINQPRLTQQMLPAAIAAISSDDLETAMQIVGVKNIEELAYSTDGKGNTLLAYAAEHGRAKPIRVLLSKVLDPQQLMQKKNNAGFTPIMIAADFGHTNVITAILKGVSNPQQLAEQIGAKGYSALHLAVEHGHETAVTAILRNVPNLQKLAEQKNHFDYSPLKRAVLCGRETVVTAILSNVDNPQQLAEQQSLNDNTLLMYAVTLDASTLIITKILEHVADAEKLIFQERDDGWNSFTYALKKGNMGAALLLFDKAKDKTALLLKKNNPDQRAGIEMMAPDILKKFLEKYNNLNQ